MKRKEIYLVSAALGAALLAAGGSAWAQMAAPNYPGYPYNYPYGSSYSYPYGSYSPDPGNPFAWLTAPVGAAASVPGAVVGAATAPLTMGRSAAESGNHCTTPAKTCMLHSASWVGNGCSCRVPGGRAHGSVTP